MPVTSHNLVLANYNNPPNHQVTTNNTAPTATTRNCAVRSVCACKCGCVFLWRLQLSVQTALHRCVRHCLREHYIVLLRAHNGKHCTVTRRFGLLVRDDLSDGTLHDTSIMTRAQCVCLPFDRSCQPNMCAHRPGPRAMTTLSCTWICMFSFSLGQKDVCERSFEFGWDSP